MQSPPLAEPLVRLGELKVEQLTVAPVQQRRPGLGKGARGEQSGNNALPVSVHTNRKLEK